jgi:ABC-type Zn2+ transport system substrate-binding protein/surface adhesin
MPLYRFNLEDHHFIADRGMHDCLDEEHAREIADEIADRLVQAEPNLRFGGHAIVVRNEHNQQIYRAEMDGGSIVGRRQH